MRRRARRCVAVVVATFVAGILPTAAVGQSAGPTASLSEDARDWLAGRNDTIRVGWGDFGPPFTIRDDGGDFVGGYAYETWELGALKAGVRVQHVDVGTLDDLVGALAADEIDVIGGTGMRPDVTGLAATVPYAWVPTTFVASPMVAAARPSQLRGLSVATVPGSPLVETLADRFPELEVRRTPSIGQALQDVADDEVDLFFGPLALIGATLLDLDEDLAPFGPRVSTVQIAARGEPGSPAMEVAELVRQQVDETELRLLHVRWTGFDLTRPDDGSVPEWLLPVGAGLLAALLLAGGATLVLRRRVRVATEELTALNMNLEGLVAERTEQLEEHSHRLRRSNAALQRFAEMAAHDLKGPVTAMAGMADILRTVELPEAQHDRVLGRIQAGAHRLGRMLDDMLGDAVGIGTPTVQVTGREFASWLREVTSPELSIIDAELDVAAPPDTIDTDIEVLRRTALNLVGNAAKYAVNERGRTRVEVRLVRRDDVWLLRVDDNGPGIPPSLWGQVFDRGTRLVDDDRGHGLGLAAIRDLVQGAGGAIRLATSDLGGARFVVTLPTAAVPLDSVVDGGVSPARG